MNDNIKIYTADVSALKNAEVFDYVYKSVNQQRKDKTDKLKLQKDKILSLGAGYILMIACKDSCIDYDNARFVTNEYGKPSFADNNLYFNLSHSGERVMCVVSDYETGCDVEKIHTVNQDIAHRYFTESECSLINSAESETAKQQLFFRLWTLKESYMKCLGLGFHLSLSDFSISVEEDKISVTQKKEPGDFHFIEFGDDNYRYSVCVKNDNPDFCTKDISMHKVIIKPGDLL